jgi:hypothetical protein
MVFENNGVNVAPPSNGDNTLHMLDKVKLFLTKQQRPAGGLPFLNHLRSRI